MYHLCSCVCCREHPVFLIFMQLAVISIFKSYPTVGDVALYLAFLPVWSHLHRCEWGGDLTTFPLRVGVLTDPG